jgi:hypothetical protein
MGHPNPSVFKNTLPNKSLNLYREGNEKDEHIVVVPRCSPTPSENGRIKRGVLRVPPKVKKYDYISVSLYEKLRFPGYQREHLPLSDSRLMITSHLKTPETEGFPSTEIGIQVAWIPEIDVTEEMRAPDEKDRARDKDGNPYPLHHVWIKAGNVMTQSLGSLQAGLPWDYKGKDTYHWEDYDKTRYVEGNVFRGDRKMQNNPFRSACRKDAEKEVVKKGKKSKEANGGEKIFEKLSPQAQALLAEPAMLSVLEEIAAARANQ